MWSDDPRSTDDAPRVIELAAPHAPWPKPGYGSDLEAVLAESDRSHPPMRPAPDFSKLVAQYSASIHKLEFAMLASTAPFEHEQMRSLAHGALLSVRALRQAAPSHLTALVQEAENALVRVWDELR